MKILPELDGLQAAWSKLNDIWLGIETSEHIAVENDGVRPLHNDGERYQPANYWNIRRLIRTLRPKPDDVIYEIGCGKGRCVCLFAQQPVRCVVGIERNAQLCETARLNAAQVRGRRSPIEIRCEDAAAANIADGSIYFFYNPFGTETLKAVFGKIQNSLESNPRAVQVVYYNPVFEDVLLALPWLHAMGEFKTFTNRRVTFWSNRA